MFEVFPPQFLDDLVLKEPSEIGNIGLGSEQVSVKLTFLREFSSQLREKFLHALVSFLLIDIFSLLLLLDAHRFLDEQDQNELIGPIRLPADPIVLFIELLGFLAQSTRIPVVILFSVLAPKNLENGCSEFSQQMLVDGIWLESNTLFRCNRVN